MDLEKLYGGSYVNWEVVSESWAKKTVASRLLLFASRKHMKESGAAVDRERAELARSGGLPEEVAMAFASVPEVGAGDVRSWGAFVDAALAAELEMVSYGERPPVLDEIRKGLAVAASEAGEDSALGAWFLNRIEALPGSDLPEDTGYIPV